jgi:hypothetical protein
LLIACGLSLPVLRILRQEGCGIEHGFNFELMAEDVLVIFVLIFDDVFSIAIGFPSVHAKYYNKANGNPSDNMIK